MCSYCLVVGVATAAFEWLCRTKMLLVQHFRYKYDYI